MKKKINLFKVIGIVGLYSLLIIILYLVIIYKVKWENKDLNTYLYFYTCSEKLICTSQIEQKEYLSKILCNDKKCPYIKEYGDNKIVTLANDIDEWLYNYKTGDTINNTYTYYKYIKDNKYIVTKNNKQGIIDIDGNIIIDFNYDKIKEYHNDYITYVKDNKYGIINTKENIDTGSLYEDATYIDNKIYIYKLDNKYYISNYNISSMDNDIKYDYIINTSSMLISINNKQLNILDFNLNSKLVMPINTYFEYTIEQERETLNIKEEDNNIYFTVYLTKDSYTNYQYDIKNNKLINLSANLDND